ncbi:hypothetical protein L6452_42109 [Arctium lappa]|uniref:Uncharacterized protein n=1 Tax=Arctium lappa TaxID=4217 RepID=A0ACB8XLE0_ARCLA|nr:hypothetical protein L6452_42109 [Arctium lappa]
MSLHDPAPAPPQTLTPALGLSPYGIARGSIILHMVTVTLGTVIGNFISALCCMWWDTHFPPVLHGPTAASGGSGVAAAAARAAAPAATAVVVVDAVPVRAPTTNVDADVYGDAYVAAYEDSDADNGARVDDAKTHEDSPSVALPEFSHPGLVYFF